MYCSYLSTEGEWHFMPSGDRWILGRVEGLWPFIWQVVASLCMALGDAAGASFPGFAEDTYA